MMEIRRCCGVDLHIYTVATSSAVEKEIIIKKTGITLKKKEQ